MKGILFSISVMMLKLISLMPWWVKWGIADIIYVGIYRIYKYRINITRENLKKSFPEKSEEERLLIEKKYYRHLANLFVEIVSMFTASRKKLQKRVKCVNHTEWRESVGNGSYIVSMGHVGNWEIVSCLEHKVPVDHFFPVYRELFDKKMDALMLKLRSKFGAEPVEMKDVARKLIKTQRNGEIYGVVLIGDQSAPHYDDNDYWEVFLNQEAVFFSGTERVAQMFKLPICYLNATSSKRGYYNIEIIEIWDGKEELKKGEITHRYVEALEANIREQPELWTWSHRRWKAVRR